MSAPWWDSDWKDRSGPEYRCYVGNLPYGTDEGSLKNAFSNYGDVISSEVVVDRETGRSRGFGFVQFEDKKSMDNAIQGMNGQQIGGRSVTVSEANQRPRRWRA
ncbi:Glycine-rich RNA-binding protein 7 [Dichanthelium oligosanthes]|uniref:Glycine-rich RNA-binding protein 7 n=1 Tax=Dichanthelium oligosanthes TaxID=888268 RepID=A0A1E5V325_9POAL|nr:Glycine-rich RNA-binding protein 7 [Dichanthelium oligosanthes]